MRKKQTYYKSYRGKWVSCKIKFGTLFCYSGDSAIDFYVCDNKASDKHWINSDFPEAAFCGNVCDGTENVKMAVDFLNTHGSNITESSIVAKINKFKKQFNRRYMLNKLFKPYKIRDINFQYVADDNFIKFSFDFEKNDNSITIQTSKERAEELLGIIAKQLNIIILK